MSNLKPMSALLIAIVAGVALSGPADAKTATQIRQDAIEKREAAQAHAIIEGRTNGSLTWWERYRLVREQRRIEKLEAQTLADGKITRSEYYAIKSSQNDARSHIRDETHNEDVRGWWWRTFVR